MSVDIEQTSSGYGVIRTGGHTFTRRTYRIARRRAISRLLAAHDAYTHACNHCPGSIIRVTLADYLVADWEARQIINRGRREGKWS